MTTNILSFGFLIILALLALLFNQLSEYLFRLSGYELYSIAWASGKVRWGMSIALLLFTIGFALLFQMNVLKLYSIWKGRHVVYVELGQDLSNSDFYYDLNDPTKKLIHTPGNELNQRYWFFDTFHDLKSSTVIRYGDKPDQVYSLSAFHPLFMMLGTVLEILFLGVVLLLAFSVVGAYLEHTRADLHAYQGESSFVTALKWLRLEHPGFLNKLMSGIGMFYVLWFAVTVPPAKKLVNSTEKYRIVEKLPSFVRDGAVLTGIFKDYSIDSSTQTNTNNPGSNGRVINRHINVLIQFANVFDVPVHVRFSLQDLDKNWNWLESWKKRKGQPVEVELFDGKRIWPVGLAHDPEDV